MWQQIGAEAGKEMARKKDRFPLPFHNRLVLLPAGGSTECNNQENGPPRLEGLARVATKDLDWKI